MCNRLMRVCTGEPAFAPRRLRRRPSPRLHSCEAGQQMVLVSLMLPILLVFVGLVVDVGNVFVHRRMAQNAADAAALAGSVQLPVSKAKAQATALAYAANNGYSNSGSNTVTVEIEEDCVTVWINEQVRPLLASLIWNGVFDVGAKSVACMMFVDLAASVIVLEPEDSGALQMSGNGQIQVSRGNIQINSRASGAVTMSGNARIVTQTPTTIVGGYRTSGNAALSPEPITGAPVIPDPLAGLPALTPEKCSSKQITGSADLVQGIYCYTGGIRLSGLTKLKLEPGKNYWIKGGIKLSGKAELSGLGVMLYIVDNNVDLSGGGKVTLTPSGSGVYAGVTFFGARSEDIEFDLSGGSSLRDLEGIIYSANGSLELSGGSTMRANFAVRTISMSGNGILNVEGYTSTNWGTTEYRMTE